MSTTLGAPSTKDSRSYYVTILKRIIIYVIINTTDITTIADHTSTSTAFGRQTIFQAHLYVS